jgi:hypothetical protein
LELAAVLIIVDQKKRKVTQLPASLALFCLDSQAGHEDEDKDFQFYEVTMQTEKRQSYANELAKLIFLKYLLHEVTFHYKTLQWLFFCLPKED